MCGEEKVKVALFVFLVGGGVILCYICCFSFCSRVVGKLFDVAMWSMVFHSLSWRVRLRGSLHHANSMHSNIQLSPTLETNNQISFLDLIIISKSQQLEIDIQDVTGGKAQTSGGCSLC